MCRNKVGDSQGFSLILMEDSADGRTRPRISPLRAQDCPKGRSGHPKSRMDHTVSLILQGNSHADVAMASLPANSMVVWVG